MSDSERIIVVTGASGFIGQAIVRVFLENGWHVRAFVRRSNVWPFPENPHLTRYIGDMRDEAAITNVCMGAWGVVHAAAKKSDEADSEAVNVGGAKNLVSAAKKAGIRCIVNIGTQSSKLKGAGLYGQTKKQSDEILNASGIPVTTLRLSLVYGPGMSGVFMKLVHLARLPLTPILGKGNVPFRPIYVDDVADAVKKTIDTPSAWGPTYDIGGPEESTLVGFLRIIKKQLGIHSPMIHIPIWVLLGAARILSVLPRPPVSVSNIRGGLEAVSMDTTPFNEKTGFRPRQLAEGLEATFKESYERKEARILLTYCMRPSRIQWIPTERDIEHYLKALKTHNIAEHRIDDSVLSSFGRLMALDLACCMQKGFPIFRKKVSAAAALVETNPLSAEWLLPMNRTYAAILVDGCKTLVGLLLVLPRTIAYLLSSSFLARNGGY